MRRPSGESPPRNGERHIPLQVVISTAELRRRGARPADHEAENRALLSLAQEMIRPSGNILQKLVETALDVCRAHSAGIRILREENGRQSFHWAALAGCWSHFREGAMAAGESPGSTILDRDDAHSMPQPELDYLPPEEMMPAIVEALPLPFHAAGKPIGELWLIAHDKSCRFDGEDARLMTGLGQFAALAYQALAARESERRLAAIVESSQDAVISRSLDGIIQSWNTAAERLFGYTVEQTVGRPISFLIPPERTGEEERIIIRLRCGERVAPFDTVRLRDDGQSVPVSLSLSPITNEAGQIVGISEIVRDIAERKRIEEELRASRQDLEDFFENSITPMHWLAGDKRILRVNQAELDLLGYLREEYVGHHIAEFHVDRAAVGDLLARLSRGETIDKYPARLRAKDGSIKHVAISSSVQFRNGEFVNTRCITLDMTAERCAETALRESERRLRALSQTLERRVEARTAELQRQAARLRRLTGKLTSAEQRERKRLAAILHDGLQQLLVAAKIRLGQARSQIQDSTAQAAIEDVTELLGQAVDSSRNLTRELRPPVLYEGGLIPALRWLASELLRLHGLHVVIDAEDMQLPLSDDAEVLLFESVRELLFNVTKHADVQEAIVRAHQDAESLQIAVEDEGVGFDADAVVREEDPQQLGLGLFSIRERLTALGGDMAIDSVPGDGARIRLAIPLILGGGEEIMATPQAPSPAAVRSQAPDAVAADCQARVLVVDDHAIVREGIANVLSSDKRLVVVGEAADGVEAIEAVEQRRPNVVLIDVNMPRMNGVEATREIHRRWPGVRIVALSVQDDTATARTMIQAGAAAFVSKSDDAAQMIDAVLARTRFVELRG